jgi:hypothetical protein
MTKPIITPADYSLVGCNTAWPTIVSAPWTDNCGVGGAKSGNIDGVAEQYKLVQMVVLNIDYTFFNATDDCGNAADQKQYALDNTIMTKPIIIPAADYSVGM